MGRARDRAVNEHLEARFSAVEIALLADRCLLDVYWPMLPCYGWNYPQICYKADELRKRHYEQADSVR